jgi:lipoprotein NlpD
LTRQLVILPLLLVGLLAGCNKTWAPVEDRSSQKSSYKLTNDGSYRVRRGDTLHAIAFNFGLDWRDIAAWNGIISPYVIYPDQELRLIPAKGQPRQKQVAKPSSTPATNNRSQASTGGTTIKAAPPKTASSTSYKSTTPALQTTPVPAADPGSWLWPVEGRILSNFKANDPARNGIDIGGKEGQAVKATASGEVVYSGNGLIGYGELIIIKHSDRMLSAYAHNRKRLVGEGQKVKQGERIADMGRNDRNQAMLHFEIRLNGKPQDPLKYLKGR